jgi:succinyl-CoA synthetase alpha subunit
MMEKVIVKKKTYHDSAFLMRLARDLNGLEGVEEAVVLMGTEMNRKLVADAGFSDASLQEATPMDMMVALRGRDEATLEAAHQMLLNSLSGRAKPAGASTKPGSAPDQPHSLDEAFEAQPDANLVSIAVPGRYAAYVAGRALERDRHVFLFSDNVSIEHEVDLKRRGAEKGLLVMGPDCGTSIIGGVGLGFANRVERGEVGIVGPSGTGIQELTCQVASRGKGVSQAIGTGSRDLGKEVGGVMTELGLRLLGEDLDTKVCVVVAKHPDPGVADRLHELMCEMEKPVVVRYLGHPPPKKEGPVIYAQSLDHAAAAACQLADGEVAGEVDLAAIAAEEREKLKEQPAVKELTSEGRLLGLFGGGSLAVEAKLTCEEVGLSPRVPERPLASKPPISERGDLIVDVGEDFYTVGKPHPMVDQQVRCDLIRAAGGDPSVGVLLFDLVLGDGAHPDPAPELAGAVADAQQARREAGAGPLVVIASVSGTDSDPQDTNRQRAVLAEVGVWVQPTPARAARLAAELLSARRENKGGAR